MSRLRELYRRPLVSAALLCFLGLLSLAQTSPAAAVSAAPRPLPKPDIDGLGQALEEIPAPPASKLFRIATGARDSSAFEVGQALAAIISHPYDALRCDIPDACGPAGLNAIAQSSGGSVRNLIALSTEQVSSALVQADLLGAARSGAKPFTEIGPQTQIEAIAALFSHNLLLVVRREAGIKSIRDLGGKRVFLGEGGSDSFEFSKKLFASLPGGKVAYTEVNTDIYDATDRMLSGKIDALLFLGIVSDDLLAAFAGDPEIDMIQPLSDDDLKAVTAENPFWQESEITVTEPSVSGETGQTTAVPTLSVKVLWVVNKNIPEDWIYQMTGALWQPDNLNYLRRNHIETANLSMQSALPPASIPLHPGAERYYREKGILPDGDDSY